MFAWLVATPRKRGPIATLSRTLFQGKTASRWKTYPTLRPTAVTDWPNTETEPALGASRPAMSARVVDLPQPVGPTIAQNSPAATVRSRSRSAVNDFPVGDTNRFVTPRSSIAAARATLSDTVGTP